MGTKTQRFGQVLGGLLAVAIVIGMAGFVVWALPQLEDSGAGTQILGQESDEDRVDRTLGALKDSSENFNKDDSAQLGGIPSFAFNSPRPVGSEGPPGHWCAREVIGYRIDFTGAELAGGDQAQELYRWRKAFQQWSEASKGRYTFEYRGEANYPIAAPNASIPIDFAIVPEGEIAITYATDNVRNENKWRDRLYRPLGGILGTGGVQQVAWTGESAGLLQRGAVVLDAVDVLKSPLDVPGVYPHELGHALGLAHAPTRNQLMSEASGQQAVMEAGDREGIRRLARAGC